MKEKELEKQKELDRQKEVEDEIQKKVKTDIHNPNSNIEKDN